MLQSADNDARSDLLLLGKMPDLCGRWGPIAESFDERLPGRAWDQPVGGECVCLTFLVIVGARVIGVDMGLLLAMENDVGRFVEKREPELIGGGIAITDDDHRSIRGKPLGRAKGQAGLRPPHEHHGHP